MSSFASNAYAELRAATFPARRRARFRLHALANDALASLGRPARFPENFAEQWRRVLGRSEDVLAALPAADGPRVLFGSMFGNETSTRVIDSITALALRLRGARPLFLACDEGLPACEWNRYGNFEPAPGAFAPEGWHRTSLLACRACTLRLAESHTLPGFERVSLGRFAEPGDLESARAVAEGVSIADLRSVVHEGVRVGEYAYASLLKGLLRGVPEDDERTRWLAQRYLTSATLLALRATRAFEELRPERLVTADGVYLTGGVLCDVARQRGVHVVVYGAPYRKGTVWFSHHESYHRALINEKNERWLSFEMTPERTRVADEYLASKHLVARDYTSYHVNAIQDDAAIRQELGLDQRPLVTLYTNVLWDAQLYYRFNVYPNMLEWLFDTIRFFGEHPELQLAIRLHPGEAPGGMPTNQPILPEIERRFPALPENVKLVRPESKVSSYVLGTMSRAALVYGARMGVELVMLGTPVVVAGEAFMRGKGFTLDPSSREDYLALLARSSELPPPSDEARARARRWYYYYFFRMMMDFPYFRSERVGSETLTALAFASLSDLLPGRSPVLDRVCQGILDRTTQFEWDTFE
jgi:hypothetical protein